MSEFEYIYIDGKPQERIYEIEKCIRVKTAQQTEYEKKLIKKIDEDTSLITLKLENTEIQTIKEKNEKSKSKTTKKKSKKNNTKSNKSAMESI